MRKILIGLAVLVAVIVAAAFVAPRFIPTDSLKANLAAQVHMATGRDLAIDGDLTFTVLPQPGVSASGVRLSNAERAQADDMLRLKSAQITVALRPLFSGRVEIERVVLVEPVLELEQWDGGNNWTFAPAAPPADRGGADRKSTPAAGGAGGLGDAVQLNDLVVRGGTIAFRGPGGDQRVEAINASFGASSLAGPFRAEGELSLHGMRSRFRVGVGQLESGRAVPLSLTAGVADSELTFSGVLSGFPNEPRVAGQLTGEAADPAALFAALSGQRGPAVLGGAPLAIKADVSATRAAVALNNVSLGLAGLNATGAVNVSLEGTPRAEIALTAGRLDLDRLLANMKESRRAAGGSADRSVGASPGTATPGASRRPADAQSGGSAGGFVLPAALNAVIETEIDAVIYRGGVIHQAALNAQLADGELTISQLSAQLPGGADVSLFGFVTARDGKPAFGGQGEANADDLRGLLSWLGIELPTVPLDRLRKLTLTTKLDGVPDQLKLTDIDLAIDGVKVRGAIAVALGQRLGLGIGLSLDKLNLDAYLPATAPSARVSGATPQTGSTSKATGGESAAVAPRAGGLAFLGSFDSVLQLKAGTLTYRGASIQGINVDGTLAAGDFELRDMSAKSLAGARAQLTGRIGAVATAAPVFDLGLEIDAEDTNRLLQMFDAAPSFPVGSGRARGSLTGNLDNLDLNLSVAALDAELTAKGNLTSPTRDPAVDLTFDATHDDARTLLARLSGDGAAAATGRTPVTLRVAGSVAGNSAKSAFNAGVTVGAGSVNIRGQLSGAGTQQMSGGIAVTGEHPDLAEAVRLLAPDYRPALAEPGPLKFSTDLAFDPTTLRLDNLRGNAGPVAFESSANVVLDRPRPRMTGELKTSEIIVDWFLPVRRAAAAPAGAPAARAGSGGQPAPPTPTRGRWSSEPIDVSALRGADAEVTLTAPSITYADLKVDQPKVAINLANGVLDLRELSGRAYGGAFTMTGQMAATDVPSLRYGLTIDGADAARFTGAAGQRGRGLMSVLGLLFPVSNVKLTSGVLNAKVDVAARGRSERELIGALSGNGSVSFTDAVAEGVDLCRISNQLGNLNGLEGFLGLVLSAQGGTTKIANYAGRFDITKGVANLPQQRITADCATVDFTGAVDLPRWLIDVQAKALFPEHPKFPGVVVAQQGPLDAPNTRLVNSNQVQQYIIGKSAGAILRKVVPEIDQRPAPAPQNGTDGKSTPAPAPPPEPVDQFRGILQDLLRKR